MTPNLVLPAVILSEAGPATSIVTMHVCQCKGLQLHQYLERCQVAQLTSCQHAGWCGQHQQLDAVKCWPSLDMLAKTQLQAMQRQLRECTRKPRSSVIQQLVMAVSTMCEMCLWHYSSLV